MKHVEIKPYNGEPTIFVDGEPISVMSFTASDYADDEYLKNLGKSGIKIFYVMANTDWLRPGGDITDENGNTVHKPSGFERFEIDVKNILKNIPDAYIFVRIIMHPPTDWVENHPDDIVRYSDGGIIPVTQYWGMVSEGDTDTYIGHYSLASENWQRDASKALEDFCERADKSSIADSIIGYFFCAGGTCEWYYFNTSIIDFENNRVADYSPAFKNVYSKYLREKYVTEENLKKSWRMENASFDDPIIPSLEDRQHIDTEKTFLVEARENGVVTPHVYENDAPCFGLFLNTDKYQHVADFYDAWHSCAADSIICFGKVIKERYKERGMLTGAFFAAWACTDFYNSPTSGGTSRVLNSDAIDYLATPPTYANREPGGFTPQRAMHDSFRIRNKIFISEEDTRTHIGKPDFWHFTHRLFSERDSIVTLKRDFARNICEGTFAWWFDLDNRGHGWYQDKAFYNLFDIQQKIGKLSAKNHRGKSSEIAAIYSTDSLHCVARYTNRVMLDYYRSSELYRIGTGLDFYLSEDMDKENMPDYKVYLMINLFSVSDKERAAIISKAAKNGAMIIWLYAPGIINPDSEKRVSTDNIEKLTGIHTVMEEEICIPEFKISRPVHNAVRYADIDRFYGYLDRNTRSNVGIEPLYEPNLAYSYLYIDDEDAEILGRYCFNGKGALAMKKDPNGITHVYCAAKILRSELLTSLAEYAGCHIYNSQDDCVYANNNFVTVHAAYTGKHTVRFKEVCNPFEVYEKKYYAKNVSEIEVEMEFGDTLMFSVNDKLSDEISQLD